MKILQMMMLVAMMPMNVFAQGGAMGGGGGDPWEARVNEIRVDIRKWVREVDEADLELPANISFQTYVSRILYITTRKKVSVTFIVKDSKVDTDLSVNVAHKPKTCRSFYSSRTGKPNIVCNLERFRLAAPADQYRLIHHEYAGLMSLERNTGADSDYFISNQLTDFLSPVSVLRLGSKKTAVVQSSQPQVQEVGGVYFPLIKPSFFQLFRQYESVSAGVDRIFYEADDQRVRRLAVQLPQMGQALSYVMSRNLVSVDQINSNLAAISKIILELQEKLNEHRYSSNGVKELNDLQSILNSMIKTPSIN